jgi:hypothetical protein
MGPVKKARKAAGMLLPWAALIGGGLGWALSQQIGSESVFDHCTGGTLTLVLVVGLLGLLLSAAGGLLSWRVWRSEEETEARRFIAAFTCGVAALLALAILLQSLSAPIVGCFG